jgi:hypothetical protein
VIGLLAVLVGYGVAAVVAAAARGSIPLGDEVGLVLVGATPALGVLGTALGIVGTRRMRLRWLAWIDVVLGGVLVIASIALIVALILAVRSFS